MPVIAPLPGKLAAFSFQGTAYQFSKWAITFTLDTGKVMHFDSQQDAMSNYWPTIFSNFATGEGTATGAVDHNVDTIPIGPGLYIGNEGTGVFLHATGDGFSAEVLISKNDPISSDASASDPAQRGVSFILTGPPSRIFS